MIHKIKNDLRNQLNNILYKLVPTSFLQLTKIKRIPKNREISQNLVTISRNYTTSPNECFICCKNRDVDTENCLLCNYRSIFDEQPTKKTINIFELFNTTPSVKICMKELRNKYANLARIYNPDRYSNNGLDLSQCQKISSEVNNAYTCLKNDVCRVEQFLKHELGIEVRNIELDENDLSNFYNEMLSVNEEIAKNKNEKELEGLKDFLTIQKKYYLREIQKLAESLNLAEYKQLSNHKLFPMLPIKNIQKSIATSFSKVKVIHRTIVNLGKREKDNYLKIDIDA